MEKATADDAPLPMETVTNKHILFSNKRHVFSHVFFYFFLCIKYVLYAYMVSMLDMHA